MFSPAQRPDCCATDPSCGSARPSSSADVRDVADGVHTGEAGHREVRADVEAATAAGEGPALCAIADPDSPPPQTTVRAGMVLPSLNSTRSGWTAATPASSFTSAPASVSFLSAYSWAFSENGASKAVAAVDDGDLARLGEPPGARATRASARPAHRWSPPRSGRRRRPRHRASRARVGSPRTPLQIRILAAVAGDAAQPLGVGHRVQRECMLFGAGDPEEVRPGARCHHQMRPVQGPPVGQRQAAFGQVGRGTFAVTTVTVG